MSDESKESCTDPKRAFKGIWIPSEIWLDHRLSVVERTLWSEIHCFGEHGCWKTNETLGNEFGISMASIKRALAELVEKGLIVPAGYRHRCRVWKSTVRVIVEQAHNEPSGDALGSNRAKYQAHIEPQSNNNESKKKKDNDYSSDFLKFWERYPKKVNKQGAYKAWKARIKEGVKDALLEQCLENYRMAKAGTEEQYLLHPATFLGPNHRYLDYEKPKSAAAAEPVESCWYCKQCNEKNEHTGNFCLACKVERVRG